MMIVKDGIKMPRRSTIGSAGYDFFSPDTYELKPNEWTMIDTGVSFDTPKEQIMNPYGTKWFMALFPKSGLSTDYGFQLRSTGIIDMDYRDTIKAMVTVDKPYTLQKDEKFLQGIVMQFATFSDEIPPTEERKGGHGSTGRF